jgi:hypothetical protein
MREQTKNTLSLITDTFTGADGGVSFILTRGLIEELDKRAAEGDKDAQKVLDVVTQFSNIIKLANK